MMRRTTTDSAATALAAILLLPVLGCAGIQRNPDAVALYQGTYTFSGQVSQHLIDGHIAFTDDRYQLSSNVGFCTGRMTTRLQRKPQERTSFSCDGLLLQFRVAGSELDTHALASMRVEEGTDVRTVCKVWGTDAQGKRVCTQTGVKLETKYATRQGTLTVAKVEPDGN
jgi:hypothetical protein